MIAAIHSVGKCHETAMEYNSFLRRGTILFMRLNEVNLINTVEPRFNEVAGDRPNLFVKWRVRYIENLDITNLRGNDQNVRYLYRGYS